MNARIRRWGLAAVLLAVATGCGFTKPTMKFKTANLREIDLEGTTVDVVYTVNNPNPIGLSLAKVAYKFEVEGHQVVAGQPASGLAVAKKGSTDLIFPARVLYRDIFPVMEVFLKQDQAAYRASGEVGIQTPIGILAMPLSYSSTFQVPKIPKFEFQSPSLQGITFTSAKLVFPLLVTNRNPFPLPACGFNASFAIGGKSVGNSETTLPAMAANESKVIELPLNVNFSQAGMAVSTALRSRSAHVQLDGGLRAGASTIPIKLSEKLSFR